MSQRGVAGMFERCVEQDPHVRIRKLVVGITPRPAHLNDAVRPQQTQRVRRSGFAHSGRRRELADARLADPQCREQTKPAGIGEHGKHLRRIDDVCVRRQDDRAPRMHYIGDI